MKVVVDGELLEDLSGVDDVMSVVTAVSDRLSERRCGIVEFRYNNAVITPEDVAEKIKAWTPQPEDVLEFRSAPIARLVDSALTGMDDYLPELAKACRNIAEVFQGETPEDGFDMFKELAEAWMEIKNRELQATNLLELDLDTLLVEGVSMSVLHEELNGFLEEAADALNNKDYVLLGDLLEYELAPRAELETEIVSLLRGQLDADAK